jgi:cytochrome P450
MFENSGTSARSSGREMSFQRQSRFAYSTPPPRVPTWPVAAASAAIVAIIWPPFRLRSRPTPRWIGPGLVVAQRWATSRSCPQVSGQSLGQTERAIFGMIPASSRSPAFPAIVSRRRRPAKGAEPVLTTPPDSRTDAEGAGACPAPDLRPLFACEQDAIRCPYPHYAPLRAAGPVWYDAEHDVYVVSRYEDIERVNTQPRLYSNRNPMGPTVLAAISGMQRVLAGLEPELAARAGVVMTRGGVLFLADPPAHTRHRQILNRALTPTAVGRLEEAIRGACRELVDAFPTDGRVDLVAAYATPAPIRALALLLDVPSARGADFARWANAINASIGANMTDAQILATIRVQMEFWEFFEQELERRGAAPGHDLLSTLVAAARDGDPPLTRDEMVGFCSQLIGAGADTTTKLISSAMLQLCSRPALLARLRARPADIPAFLEESLRYDAPVQGLFRVATADTELGGVRIPAGAHVWVLYGSGNRDESVYAAPDDLDPDRPGLRSHLAFGYGPHFCIGAPLARAVARIAFEVLLERSSVIALQDPAFVPVYEPSYVMHGMRTLPVRVERA